MKKIPNFLSNSSLEVSNTLYKCEDFIIGDSEKVLDIKNQYIIATYSLTIYSEAIKELKKIKDLAYVRIFTQEEVDNHTDLHFYPLIDIKTKGSGIRDILSKNKHAPTGFICVHNFTNIHRRGFDMYDNFHKFTKKKYLVKSIKITSKNLCFFPISKTHNFNKNPFIEHHDFVNKTPKSFEEYELENINSFQKELNLTKKQKNKKKGIDDIVKYNVDNGIYDVYNCEHNGDILIFVLKK